MLDRNLTRIDKMYEVPALSSVNFTTEGLVCQLAMEGGTRKARPSSGLADSIFLGFSWGIPDQLSTTKTHVELKTAVASVVTLSYPAISGADFAIYRGTGFGGTQLTAAADAGDPGVGEYGLSGDGKTVLLNAADATAQVFVVYRYAPTVIQARHLWGETAQGQIAPHTLGKVGVITSGEVFTDQFAVSVNWGNIDTLASGEILRGHANGRIGVGGTGCVLNGCHVIQAPTPDYPYLGVKVGLLA